METNVKFLAAALAAACLTGSLAAANEPALDKAEGEGITEVRVFVQGDALHLAKEKMLPGVALSSSFTSKIQYPENWDWAAKGSIMDAGIRFMLDADQVQQQKSVTYPDPTPPDGTPPIGTNVSTTAACFPRRSGPGGLDVTYGNMTWQWTYGYRVDSNGDGKKDSDPGWYLTTETFTPYQETQQNPILC